MEKGKKFLKRGFALGLALAMVIGNNSYYSSSKLKADELTEETAGQEASYEVETDEPETVSEESSAVEEEPVQETEVVEESSEPEVTEEESEESNESEEEIDEDQEESDEEEQESEDEEIKGKEYVVTADDGTEITVVVPDGAFEKEVNIQATAIKEEAKLDELEEKADEQLGKEKVVVGIVAYDITFIEKDSKKEVEPSKEVTVKINVKEVPVDEEDVEKEDVDSVSVFHEKDNGKVEEMTTVNSNTTDYQFNTDSFSTYYVVATTTAAAAIDGTAYLKVQDAIDAAQNGDTIEILASKTESVSIDGKKITINIGKAYTLTGSGKSTITVKNNADLTLTGEGTVAAATSYRAITATNSDVTVNGPTIEGSSIGKEATSTIAKTSSCNTSGVETISTQSSKAGGVILVTNGNFTLTSGTVQKGSGGLTTSTSSSNYVYGGSVAVIDGTLSMTGGKILNTGSKTNQLFGGAVYVGSTIEVEKAKLNISGVTFDGGTNAYGGGYIYVVAAESNIANSTFVKGVAGANGGGAILVWGGSMTLDGNTFTNNTTSSTLGGAIRAQNADLTVNSVTFTSNSATGSASEFSGGGGAIYYTDGDFTRTTNHRKFVVNGGTFDSNTSATDGGAIYSGNYAVTEINGGTFINNSAINGGALYVSANYADPIITGATFKNNTASSKGGAIFGRTVTIANKQAHRLLLDDVTITGNTAAYGGGTAYVVSASAKGVDCSSTGITITDGTKSYENTATSDNEVAGTSKHQSDEFLLYRVNKQNTKSPTVTGFDNHSITISDGSTNTEYKLLKGNTAFSVSNGYNYVGYYNEEEIKIAESDCFNSNQFKYYYNDGTTETYKTGEVIVLDAGESHVGEHYKWNATLQTGVKTTEDDIYTSRDEYSADKIYTTVSDAVEAAKELGIDTILVCSEATLNTDVSDITFVRCKSNLTGSMFTVEDKVTLTDVKVLNNNVKVQAGTSNNGTIRPVIDVDKHNLTITGDKSLVDGTGKGGNYGGLICVNQGTFTLTGGTLQNGTTDSSNNYAGGAIWVQGDKANVYLNGGTIQNCSSGNGGGAVIAYDYATIYVGATDKDTAAEKGTTFTNNTAYYMGGAIEFASVSYGYIYKGTFTNNSVKNVDGGAIYVDGSGGYTSSGQYVPGDGSKAKVYMKNVYISGNGATSEASLNVSQLGTCETGETRLFSNDGALVTNSTGRAVDIYKRAGYPIYVSDTVLGGGNGNWTGTKNYNTTTGAVSLTSDETTQTNTLAKENAKVTFTGNTVGSAVNYTGAAIMNNGYLQIGTDYKDVVVKKEWKDTDIDLPDSIQVQLAYINEDGEPELVKTDTRSDAIQTLNKDNNWSATWIDLGLNTTWTVVEVGVEGYKVTTESSKETIATGTEVETFTLSNTFDTTKISIDVNKEWKKDKASMRPESISINLTGTVTIDGDNPDTEETEESYKVTVYKGDAVELSEKNKWSYTFKDLDKYSSKYAQEIKYTVTESDVEGYTAEYSELTQDKDDETKYSMTITNTSVKGKLIITKKFDGADKNLVGDTFAYRVVGTLKNGDEVYNEVFGITGAGTIEVVGLPVKKDITYTVTEIYSGSSYSASESKVENLTFTKDENGNLKDLEASFTNEYNNKIVVGGGVVNDYKADESGSYTATQKK